MTDPVVFTRYASEVLEAYPLDVWRKRWPNFTINEMASEFEGVSTWCIVPQFWDMVQHLRNAMDGPLIINSAYRTPEHNRAAGGVEFSMHTLGLAVDISTDEHDMDWRLKLVRQARLIGFNGVGRYPAFVHLDVGMKRDWVG